MQPATPEKVEEKWKSMNLALKHVIQKWEESGQGFSGFINEEDVGEEDDDYDGYYSNKEDVNNDNNGAKGCVFGSLSNCSQQSLDLRRNFVDGRSTYLIYLWDMLWEHDLFQSSMQQLKEGIGSSNGHLGVPLVIRGKRNIDNNDSLSSLSKKSNSTNVMSKLGASITKHTESMVTVAKIAAVEQEKKRQEALVEQEKN
jgi:hypothetical protein